MYLLLNMLKNKTPRLLRGVLWQLKLYSRGIIVPSVVVPEEA